MMDDVDIELLQGLLVNARESYEMLASVLEISPYEVKKRITTLRAQGVLARLGTNLNFQIFNESACFSLVKVRDGTIQSDLLHKLAAHVNHKVTAGAVSLENKMQVIHTFVNAKELRDNVEYIKSFEEVTEIENFILSMPKLYDYSKIDVENDVSLTQWRIIHSLKENCRKKDVVVARELGIATKTVRRNISHLREKGIIFFMADMDNTAGDWPAYSLIVRFSRINPRSIQRIGELATHLFYQWQIANEEAIICTIYVEKLREIEDHVREIRNLPGVKEVTHFVPVKTYYFPSWLDFLIEEKARGE